MRGYRVIDVKIMSPEFLLQITAHGAAVNLSSRAKFRFTGTDRVRYLNGQVTNDVRRAGSKETLHACVTDAKGRISGDVFIHATPDALLVDAELGLRETLSQRLERYIVADDVVMMDVTDEWQLWHVFNGDESSQDPSWVLKSCRYGRDGFDMWLPAADAAPDLGSIPILSNEEAETWRILQRVPRWPNELNADTFPPEAGLMERAMDFNKGCYIGQEILSRMKTTGKMPREMIAFESDTELKPGDPILTDKPVGTVTSFTLNPLTKSGVGLGMVRQASASGMLTACGKPLKLR